MGMIRISGAMEDALLTDAGNQDQQRWDEMPTSERGNTTYSFLLIQEINFIVFLKDLPAPYLGHRKQNQDGDLKSPLQNPKIRTRGATVRVGGRRSQTS